MLYQHIPFEKSGTDTLKAITNQRRRPRIENDFHSSVFARECGIVYHHNSGSHTNELLEGRWSI